MKTIEVKGREISFDETKRYLSIGPVDPTSKRESYDVYSVDPSKRLNSDVLVATPVMTQVALDIELQEIEKQLGRGGHSAETVIAFNNTKDLYTLVLAALRDK